MVGILSRSVMGQITKVCQEMNPDAKTLNKSKSRTSQRLRQKKKRAELEMHRKALTLREPPTTSSVELTQFPIDFENPSHKNLFLTSLGLTPVTPRISPPFLKLHRLSPETIEKYRTKESPLAEVRAPLEEVVDTNNNHNNQLQKVPQFSLPLDIYDIEDSNESFHLSTKTPSVLTILEDVSDFNAADWTNCDIYDIEDYDGNEEEDLDLELIISPVDIPEFFNEIFPGKSSSSSSSSSSQQLIEDVEWPLNSSSGMKKCSSSDPCVVNNTPQQSFKASVHLFKAEGSSARCGRASEGISANSSSSVPYIDLSMDEDTF